MSKEKILMLLIESLVKEAGVATLEELIVVCMRYGIRVSKQFITDCWYNYQFAHRKEIKYMPLENNHIKVPATDVKQREYNKLC